MATNMGSRASEAPCAGPGRRRSGQPSILRLCLGGGAGTAALALTMFVLDPLLFGRSSDLARSLIAELNNPHGVGLIVFHFFNGSIIFPLGFAFLAGRLKGPWIVKGLIWGIMLWLLVGAVVMPMSGYGLFGYDAGGLRFAASTLAGHLAYGGLQGLIAALPGREAD